MELFYKNKKAKKVGLIICFIRFDYRFWSKTPPSYMEDLEYTKKIREVSEKLLKWLSLMLGLEENEMNVAMGGDDAVFHMKIKYYPPCPRPDLALGVVVNTDMSLLTILVPNEVQGLQVFRYGHWYYVKSIQVFSMDIGIMLSTFLMLLSYTLVTKLR